MKSYNEIFADNLCRIMKDKDLSQNELARRIGVSATSVNLWCRGINVPRANLMNKLCEVLNIQSADLTMDVPNIPNLSIPAAFPLPILGEICCGDGKFTDESFDGFFFVDNSIRADYCLRIEGDSMIDSGIHHGDIAFIRKSYDFMEGRIYAVLSDDNRASLKKLYRQDDGILLMPSNQKYKPILKDEKDIFIVGECVGIYSPL